MGIFNDIIAVINIQKLKTGKIVPLSVSQIAGVLINLPDAQKKLSVEQFNEITLEICEKLDEYKNNIKRDMVIGEVKIIMGINLVEKMIREINPSVIDEKLILDLEFLIDNYKKLNDSKMQGINNYMMLGINLSYNVVSSYVRTRMNTKLRSRKMVGV